MKTFRFLIPLLTVGLQLAAATPRHLIIAVAPNLPDRLRDSVASATGELLYRSDPGTRVTVVTGDPFDTLTEMRVSDGSLTLRQQRARPWIVRSVRAIQSATNADAMFLVPDMLDAIARQLTPTNADIILAGPVLHRDPRQRNFNFTTNWPNDAHLSAGHDRSPFSTVERAHLLDGMSVHWLVTDTDKVFNDNQAESVRRFWSLFVATQGGVLASYSTDATSVFANATHGKRTPFLSATINPRDTNVVMRSRSMQVANEDDSPAPPIPVVITNVITATNIVTITNWVHVQTGEVMPRVTPGNSGVGIKWTQPPGEPHNVDLDLYVRVPGDGTELFFARTSSRFGRYFRDIRQSIPVTSGDWRALWEFVELDGDEMPQQIWINLYSGQGPVQGEVRIQHRGREHIIPFVFPAVRGNQGGNAGHREHDEHWLRIGLESLQRSP